MTQADFSYGAATDGAGLPVSLSLFADRGFVRSKLAEDLGGAGFRIRRNDAIAALIEGDAAALGDVVLLDCPEIDAARMAALARLDMRIARSGTALVVMTSLQALDDVFACFDQSCPQILVDAGRAELIVAVGRLLGNVAGGRVRELSEDDRHALLRLSEQVDTIARQIEGISQGLEDDGKAVRLGEHKTAFSGFEGARGTGISSGAGATSSKPKLPDPRLVRRVIAQRQARARYFDGGLFADPAWDMLLDLTAASGEGERVSVTSLCIASGVPPTTALRWIGQMTDAGLLVRAEDESDRRRAFIGLSEQALGAMARYFAELEQPMAIAA